jgi:hypothetical protein
MTTMMTPVALLSSLDISVFENQSLRPGVVWAIITGRGDFEFNLTH